MKNLPKETIFQLKSIALDIAVKSSGVDDSIVDRAQAVYDFLVAEVPDVVVKETAVVKLV